MSLNSFPLAQWVTFEIDVKWAAYTSGSNTVPTNGRVKVDVKNSANTVVASLNETGLNVGRNDPLGYYFKFGCYCHSTEPVKFLLKDYTVS